jgi:hypothetical protein
MHLDTCHVCVGWAAGILPGVGYLSVLYEQVACGHVSLLRNDAHPTPTGVVADHLVTVGYNVATACEIKTQFLVRCQPLMRTKILMDNNTMFTGMWVPSCK